MTKEASKTYREAHPERVRESKRKYYLKTRESSRQKRLEYARKWRDKNAEKHREQNRRSLAKNPGTNTCRSKVRKAVANGEIEKPTACSGCGEEKPPRLIHAHHEDHRKWREIIWLCPRCHGKRHRKYK